LTRGARLRYVVDVGTRARGQAGCARAGVTRRRPSAAVCWLFEGKRLHGGRRAGHHRIQPDARAPGRLGQGVEFGAQAMIVTVALRRKRPICSGCGARGLKVKDHRVKRWRHLDAGGVRCYIECRLRRLYCPGRGDLPEHVEWARGRARYTRDFDDLTAWLAQQDPTRPERAWSLFD
jgi:zinc-finger of transposase IS204/IS1001/IS1096/IS1165